MLETVAVTVTAMSAMPRRERISCSISSASRHPGDQVACRQAAALHSEQGGARSPAESYYYMQHHTTRNRREQCVRRFLTTRRVRQQTPLA